MADITQITDATFDSYALQSELLVIVAFITTFNSPCRMVLPILEDIALEYSNKIAVFTLNCDEQVHSSSHYGIRACPTLIFFKDGIKVGTMTSVTTKATLVNYIQTILNDSE